MERCVFSVKIMKITTKIKRYKARHRQTAIVSVEYSSSHSFSRTLFASLTNDTTFSSRYDIDSHCFVVLNITGERRVKPGY